MANKLIQEHDHLALSISMASEFQHMSKKRRHSADWRQKGFVGSFEWLISTALTSLPSNNTLLASCNLQNMQHRDDSSKQQEPYCAPSTPMNECHHHHHDTIP